MGIVIILQISLIKTSRTNKDLQYVEGQLTDGKDVCRFISFDGRKMKHQLEELMAKGESVSVMNCEIKKSRMEVHMN